MKRLLGIFLIALFAFSAKQSSAQIRFGEKTISRQKKNYYQDGKILTFPEVKTILANNPSSADEYQQYRRTSSIMTPILVTGTAAIVISGILTVTHSIQQAKDPSKGGSNGMGLTWLGLSIDLIAIPFGIIGNRHFKKSIELYNSSIKGVGARSMHYNVMASSNGLGIRMTF